MLKKNKGVLLFLGIYYGVFGIFKSFIEPLGWFGLNDSVFKPMGVWGIALIFVFPALITIIYFNQTTRKNRELKRFLGIKSVSAGSGRDDAFQSIRKRAEHNIKIVGIGMSKLSMYSKKTLLDQASNVPIDILMIDPKFLEGNKEFSSILESFLDIPDFTQSVRSAFNRLKSLCEECNKESLYKVRLRVYRTIPTISMVLIDYGKENSEMELEFYLYQSGEYRPRFLIKKINTKDSLYERVVKEYERLWENSESVIQ